MTGGELNEETVIRPAPRVVYRELAEGSGAVLLNLDTTAYHSLNRMGQLIWEVIQPTVTVGELLARLEARLSDAPGEEELRRDVGGFLRELAERQLVIIE